MENLDDLDLEDIESRLYSQVYHANADSIEESPLDASFHEPSTNYYKKKYRYFKQTLDKSSSKCTEPVETSISLPADKDLGSPVTNCPTHVPDNCQTISDKDGNFNNISVQNSLSKNSTSEISTSINREVAFQNITSVFTKQNDLLSSYGDNYKLHQYNTRSKAAREKYSSTEDSKAFHKNLRPRGPVQNIVTIFISDSDSDLDDCVVVENMNGTPHQINTKFPKKYNEEDGGTPPEKDDDIIFIPPPPIEVINVDIYDIEKSTAGNIHETIETEKCEMPNENNKPLLETPESHCSNDFLDYSNLESNSSLFNFGLHGSDFNSEQSEIPLQKSGEYCETESSCSTNEQHNREFRNTVKTIVFDEVEFPREDIFSEKTLESFSSFITPRRSSSGPQKQSGTGAQQSLVLTDDISSNTSSSESDYETSTPIKDGKLPNLSPVVPYDIHNKKHNKTAHTFFKTSEGKNKVHKKDKSSKKQKDTEKTSKRKKRQLTSESDTQLSENLAEGVTNESTNTNNLPKIDKPVSLKSKKKKKKRDNLAPQETTENTEENVDMNQSLITQVTEDISDVECSADCGTEKTMKKKKNSDSIGEKISRTRKIESSDGTDEGCNAEKKRKKKKQRINSLSEKNSPQKDYSEDLNHLTTDIECTLDILNNSEKRRKRKKKKKNTKHSLESSEPLPQEPNKHLAEKLANAVSTEDASSEDTIDLGRQKKNKTDSLLDEPLEIPYLGVELSEIQVKEYTKEAAENTDLPIPNTQQDVEKPQDISKSADESLVLIENEPNSTEESEIVIVDSENSSDSVEIILSSDSESEYVILDEVDADLSLNCSTGKNTTLKVSDADIKRILDRSRESLEDFDNYSVESIQSQQSDDPAKWQISFRDRATYLNAKGNRGPRCNRCRHFGHLGIRCPDKPHAPPCTLCGRPDHQEPRCPNKRCTQCGHRADYSTTYCSQCFKTRHVVCRLCHMPGHSQHSCPDLWRRYYLTNDKGPMVISRLPPRPRHEQWCSGCAKRGHLEHECNYYNRAFPPTTPFIIEYTDVLNHNKNFAKNMNLSTASDHPPTEQSETNLNSCDNNQDATRIPLLLSLPIPDTPLQEDRHVVPNPANPNFTIHVSNNNTENVTPNNIVLKMRVNFDNPANRFNQFRYPTENNDSVHLTDIREVRHLVMSEPSNVVYSFIQKQIDYMENCNVDPRVLKRKIFKFDRIIDSKRTLPEKLLNEKNFWYRIINMFVFGIYKHQDGRLHVNHLTRYLAQSKNLKLDLHKRRSLLSSYSYIFGCERRARVNYYKIIRILIRKYCSNKSVVQ